jgi:hypothetical protein
MPGSSESGAVPTTTLTVPPVLAGVDEVDVLPAGVVADDVVELDELPHAASTTALMTASNAAEAVLVRLSTIPPPPRSFWVVTVQI